MAVEPIKLGLLLWDQRAKLVTAWKRLRRWWIKGRQTMLIVGLAGAGKSTLGRVLANGPGMYSPPHKYKESIATEALDLQGDIPATVLVAPGQEARRHRTWPALLRDLTAGKTCGIIHVVAHGHQSIQGDLSYKDLPQYQKGMRASTFLKRYITDRLNEELDVLRELQPHLMAAPGNLWMLTLVLKQDLWWEDRDTVKAHYEAGAYRKIIDEIGRKRGVEHFRHEFGYTSLVIQNLQTGQAEILAKTTSGYDELIQSSSLETILGMIEPFVKDS